VNISRAKEKHYEYKARQNKTNPLRDEDRDSGKHDENRRHCGFRDNCLSIEKVFMICRPSPFGLFPSPTQPYKAET